MTDDHAKPAENPETDSSGTEDQSPQPVEVEPGTRPTPMAFRTEDVIAGQDPPEGLHLLGDESPPPPAAEPEPAPTETEPPAASPKPFATEPSERGLRPDAPPRFRTETLQEADAPEAGTGASDEE